MKRPSAIVIAGCLMLSTAAFAATKNDGCDIGGGGNDIDSLTAVILGESTVLVTLDLCAPADATTKYQVFFDFRPGLAIGQDRNADGAVDGADFCFPTADVTMKHDGDQQSNLGSITVDGDVITLEVELSTLGLLALPTEEQPLLVWAMSKRPGIHDRVPDTDGANGCSEPESVTQVLFLPDEPVIGCPQECVDGIEAEMIYATGVPGLPVINRPECGFNTAFGGWYVSRLFTSSGNNAFSGFVGIQSDRCLAGHVDNSANPTHTTYVDMILQPAEQTECVRVMGPIIIAGTGYSCAFPP